ncbi:MAG: hypothetical protein FJ224_03130 [Lentisphaerae bacterium]|nr:hypothetical protein [Lentisphaerota bacterium]
MKKLLAIMLALVPVAVFLAGCEWEATDDEESWNDNVAPWVNFSGIYRGTGPRGYIVSKPTPGGSTDEDPTEVAVQNEPAGSLPATQTSLSGGFPTAKLPIVPGSVTIVMQGASSGGSFRDDGSGGLSGRFNLVGIDAPTKTATGTIDYETGTWALFLDSPGFLEPVNVFLSWTYTVSPSDPVIDDLPPGNTGAPIFAFTIAQNGNVLTIVDSQGSTFSGQVWGVQTAGGDSTGTTSGDVIANFQVKGTSAAGIDVTITGALQGYYTAPAGDLVYGTLSGRVINGTWVEDGGKTGDIRGAAEESVNVTP